MTKALLVGAGSVGQVYGLHLQKGGVEVSFLVKPHHVAEVRDGARLHHLRRLHRPKEERLEPPRLFTSPEDARRERWDQVWICTSSTALRGGWLDVLCEGLDAGLMVALQPGIADREYVAERFPAERVVQGVIAVVAWEAPLPGESLEPGTAYWIPPFAKTPFAGPEPLARAAAAALSAGGLASTVDQDAPSTYQAMSAALMPHLVGLEASGWSLDRFLRSDALPLASEAAKEALAIVAKETGRKTPAWAGRIGPFLVRRLVGAARLAMPVDVEVYLRHHFTKVGDQTRAMMATWRSRGEAAGLPTASMERLTSLLPEPAAAATSRGT